MSLAPPFDPLMLLLDDPAGPAALLTPVDPDLAAPVSGPAPPDPPAPAAPGPAPLAGPPPGPAWEPVPEEAFFTVEELDAMLADSYLPEPGLDLALRRELVEALGLDPALIEDEAALLAALATLPPPAEEDLPEPFSAAPSWDPAWAATLRGDWPPG